jgi:hypothetical protein
MLCYVMLRYVALRAVRSVLHCNGVVRGKNRLTEGTNTCYVMLCYVMLCYVMLCYVPCAVCCIVMAL